MLALAQVFSALEASPAGRIPILQTQRHFLQFMVGHEKFQFAVLPFGRTSTPWVFTKVMVAVAAHLRRSGFQSSSWLDDWLLKESRTPPDYGKPPDILGVHYQCAKVTPDSFADDALHLSHTEHGAESHLYPREQSPGRSSYNPDISPSVLNPSEND